MASHNTPEPSSLVGDVAVYPKLLGSLAALSIGLNNYDKLRADLIERDAICTPRYGTTLMTNNGRNALVDLYQELMDSLAYSKQKALELPIGSPERRGLDTMFGLLVGIADHVAGLLLEQEKKQ